MANSTQAGPRGWWLPDDQVCRPDKPPGPTGINGLLLSGDSPGPLGLNDFGEFLKTPYVVKTSGKTKSLTCACDRDITLDELSDVFPHAGAGVCEKYLSSINAMFKTYELGSCLRKAHCLAQVSAETGDLNSMAEGGGAKSHPDGYYGRGMLQLTTEANYIAYGKAVNHDFLGKHKDELLEPQWAADSAGWFWKDYKSLNDYADKNDLLWICARINGGYNGFDDRRAELKRAFTALQVTTCKKANVNGQDFLPYKESSIFDQIIYSFGWGYWNDQGYPKQKGIAQKSVDERKAAYTRYLAIQADHDAKDAQKAAEKAARLAKVAAAAAKHAKPGAPPPAPPPAPKEPPEPKVYGLTKAERVTIATAGSK